MDFDYLIHDNAITITAYKGKLKDVVIPDKIEGYLVKKIAKFAFKRKKLTSIKLPESLTSIGDSAFSENKITSVEIPNNVKLIEDFAFYSNRISSVDLPNGLLTLGWAAFSNNRIVNVNLPHSLTKLNKAVFCNNNIKKIVIPSKVKIIEDYAFVNNQITSVDLPNGLLTIGDSAFSYNKITSVEIPNSVNEIGMDSFSFNYINNVILPDGLTKIMARTFRNNKINFIKFPSEIKEIHYEAFDSNEITNLILPRNLIYIGSKAFQYNKITKVDFPESLKEIEDYAFIYNQINEKFEINSSVKIGIGLFDNNPISPSLVSANKNNAYNKNKDSSESDEVIGNTHSNNGFYSGVIEKHDIDYTPIVSYSRLEIKSKILTEILSLDGFYKKFVTGQKSDIFSTDFNLNDTCVYPVDSLIKNLQDLLDFITRDFDLDYINGKLLLTNFDELSETYSKKKLYIINKIKENSRKIIESIETAEIWFFVSAHDEDYIGMTDAYERLFKLLLSNKTYKFDSLFDLEIKFKYEKGEDFWECLANFELEGKIVKVHEKSKNMKNSIIFGSRHPWVTS